MVNFVIAGVLNCPKLLKVLHAAEYLKNKLPDFEITARQMSIDDWNHWIARKNFKMRWHHRESPLIYKEVLNYGTKVPQYIGGMSEFWEYCFDYYGLESKLSVNDLEFLIEENKLNYMTNIMKKCEEIRRMKTVMIYGLRNAMIFPLVQELLKIKGLTSNQGIHFIFYDESENFIDSNDFDNFLSDLRENLNCSVEYCDHLGEGIKDCDLLLILSDYAERRTNETIANETKSFIYKVNIFHLSDEINYFAKKGLRIVFANGGLSCLAASILVKYCNLNPHQVCVITSDLALPYLSEIARRINVNVSELCGAPVWGWPDEDYFVDYEYTLRKCYVFKPNARNLKESSESSTLSQGTIFTELRFIQYLSEELKDLDETVKERKRKMTKLLKRPSHLAKCIALINILKIWYGDSDCQDPIVSLGVFADGSYGINKGLVFSQPAILENGLWIPFANYPIEDEARNKITTIAESAKKALSSNHMKSRDSVQFNLSLKAKASKIFSYKSIHSRLDSHLEEHKDILSQGNDML